MPTKKGNGITCGHSIWINITSIVIRSLSVEIGACCYALWIFLDRFDIWLALAKYHGFAINLCLLLLLMSVCRNLKSLITNDIVPLCPSPPCLSRLKIKRCSPLGRSVKYHMHDHEFYSYRLLFSSLFHALVHILQSHRFNLAGFSLFRQHYRGLFTRLLMAKAPSINQDKITDYVNTPSLYVTSANLSDHDTNDTVIDYRPGDTNLSSIPDVNHLSTLLNRVDLFETLIIYDRWTVSGYLLLLLLVIIAVLGLRLSRFLAKHAYVLLIHRMVGTVTMLLLLLLHHSNYTFVVLPALLLFADYLVGVTLLTHKVNLHGMLIYPSVSSIANHDGTTKNSDKVLQIDFDVTSDRFAYTCKPGDYIAVKIPKISAWQWHNFTVMQQNDNSNDIGSTQYNFQGMTIARRKILIRCVGRWTHAILNNIDTKLSMLIKGPYRTHRSCTVGDLLSRTFNQLVLISTGTAVTHHLSLLRGLIDEYWLRETTKVTTQYDTNVTTNRPEQIRLVWIIRHSTDVNFAISSLNEMQQLLAKRGMNGLLIYDIWITKEPTLNERELNTRLQSYLACPILKCNGTTNLYSPPSPPENDNHMRPLPGRLNTTRRQFSFSFNPANRSLPMPITSIVISPTHDENHLSTHLFDYFYTNAQMHTGVRPSWNKLQAICAAHTNGNCQADSNNLLSTSIPYSSLSQDASIAPSRLFDNGGTITTCVLLNTSVERLKHDIEQLALSHGFELFIEDLWC